MNHSHWSLVFISIGALFVLHSFLDKDQLRATFLSRPAKYEESLKIPFPMSLDSLDPGKVVDAKQKALLLLMFNKLVKVNESFDIEPDLLERWEFDLEGNRYRLTLRHDVFFQDNVKLTSEDVLFSFQQWVLDDFLENHLLRNIKGVEDFKLKKTKGISGIKIIDERVLDVYLSAYDDKFILNLSSPRFVVFPYKFRNIGVERYLQAPIGTGPFVVSKRTLDHKRMELVRFEKYFMGAPISKKIILFQAFKDEVEGYLEKKEVDALFFYENPNPFSLLSNDFIMEKKKTFKKLILIFNSKVLNNEDARRSLSSVLGDTTILQMCFPMYPLTSNIIPEGLIGYNKMPVMKDLIDIASLESIRGFKVYLEDFPGSKCYAEKVNVRLGKFGIQVIIDDFQSMYKLFRANKLGAWFEGLSFKNEEPYNVLQYFRSSSNEYLLGREYSELEDLFKRLDTNLLVPQKHEVYSNIENFLVSHSLVFPILDIDSLLIYKKNMTIPKTAGNNYYISNWHEIGLKKDEL